MITITIFYFFRHGTVGFVLKEEDWKYSNAGDFYAPDNCRDKGLFN